jgi:hypothetical protein
MPAPQVFPTSRAGIQFDWGKGGRELEIEILPDGTMEYLLVMDNVPFQEGIIPSVAWTDALEALAIWFTHP